MLRQTGEVEASAEVMADMNELVKVPELTKAVQKMAKQLQKVQIVSHFRSPVLRSSRRSCVLPMYFLYLPYGLYLAARILGTSQQV